MKKGLLLPILSVLFIFAPAAGAAASASVVKTAGSQLSREVGHELLMLPHYTAFDHLEFRIDGSSIVLTGEVVNPSLKDDAERAVRSLGGVNRVQNDIHVLPASSVDNQIRVTAFRAIYGDPALSRYGEQAILPIQIIVENGQITLYGVVGNEADRHAAYMKALELPGVFSVSNHLRTEA